MRRSHALRRELPPAVFALLLAAACMPARYREAPLPETPERSAEVDTSRGADPTPARGTPPGATVVGRVSPDGTLVADTLADALPDTVRVERETVVTGEIRSASELETSERAEAGTLATGWRVQVFASREQPEAAARATRVQEALGDRVPVYVERDDPWFKVRVGDFADRAPAERLRDELAALGWSDAWAVRTTIRTAP
jgi:cell division septation protein DedD